MKLWRKIVVVTMVFAMPISSWASVMMASHCQMSDNISHSMSTLLGNSEPMLAHDHMPSPDSNNQTGCDCDDNLNCSISGCSATALMTKITIDLRHSTHSVYQRIQSLADPSEPDPIFRPPISLS